MEFKHRNVNKERRSEILTGISVPPLAGIKTINQIYIMKV
jgi:hypothetical protein